MSETVTTRAPVVDRLLTSMCDPTVDTSGVFAADAVLDAVVPRWRFNVTGGDAVRGRVIHLRVDRIVRDHAWCGGRWDAALLAEMETSAHADS